MKKMFSLLFLQLPIVVLLGYYGGKYAYMNAQAVTVLQNNMAFKDFLANYRLIQVDIFDKIISDKKFETKGFHGEYAAIKRIALVDEWYNAYRASARYGENTDSLKKIINEMSPSIARLKSAFDALNALAPNSQNARMALYKKEILPEIEYLVERTKEYMGENAQNYSVVNQNLTAYERFYDRLRVLLFALSFFIIGCGAYTAYTENKK